MTRIIKPASLLIAATMVVLRLALTNVKGAFGSASILGLLFRQNSVFLDQALVLQHYFASIILFISFYSMAWFILSLFTIRSQADQADDPSLLIQDVKKK